MTSTAGRIPGSLAPPQTRALEDVAEELIHLAAHALEVGKEIAVGHRLCSRSH